MLNIHVDEKPAFEMVRDFKNTDFRKLCQYLSSVDWSCLNASTNCTDAVSMFYNILNNLFDVCVPMKKRYHNHQSPIWFDKDLKILRNKKDRAFKLYKKTGNNSDYSEYCALRKYFQISVKQKYNLHLANVW